MDCTPARILHVPQEKQLGTRHHGWIWQESAVLQGRCQFTRFWQSHDDRDQMVQNYSVQTEILRLLVLPTRNKAICPVFWMHYVINMIPAQPTDPVLLLMAGKNTSTLSANQLIYRFRKWLILIGQDSTIYSLHLLRRGGSNFCLPIKLRSRND